MSIVIIGAGPNLGQAVARRFGREGFAVGLISRNQSKLDDLASGRCPRRARARSCSPPAAPP